MTATPDAAEMRPRPAMAFFDYPDVFEDFYPHYGVSQHDFATSWSATGNHAFVSVIQEGLADVTWYEGSLKPSVAPSRHVLGHRVEFVRSSWLHRLLWRTFYLRPWSWRLRPASRVFGVISSYVAPMSWQLLGALVRRRPDVMFLQDYASGRFDVLLVASRFLRIPLVVYHSGSSPDRYLGRWVRARSLRHADWVLASSRRELAMLVERFSVDPAAVSVVLTPIDTDAFRPIPRVEACRALGIAPDRRHMAYLGRLDDDVKRVGMLIAAFAEVADDHPDLDLQIAGDGPDVAHLRNLAERLAPGRVVFHGWLGAVEDKVALLNAADCLVLPSMREGFPTVVGEALACGTPVVASEVGAVSEVVRQGQTGWTIPPGSQRALRDALRRVAVDPTAVRAMRPSARAVAEQRFSRPAVRDALRSAFEGAGVAGI